LRIDIIYQWSAPLFAKTTTKIYTRIIIIVNKKKQRENDAFPQAQLALDKFTCDADERGGGGGFLVLEAAGGR